MLIKRLIKANIHFNTRDLTLSYSLSEVAAIVAFNNCQTVAQEELAISNLVPTAYADEALPNSYINITTAFVALPEIQHKRLSYISFNNLSIQSKAVKGIENINLTNVNKNYNSYIVSKAYRHVSTEPQVRETRPYSKLYIDTIGPVNPAFFSRKRYTLGLTKDTDRVRYIVATDSKEALN